MKKSRVIAAIKLALGQAAHFILLIPGYFLLIFGVSLVMSEWVTDRMLHQHQTFFSDLIKSQQVVPNLEQIISDYSSLADSSSVFNTIGLLSVIFGGIIVVIALIIMLATRKNIKKYYNFVGSLTFSISNNSLVVIFSTLFAISLLFISVAEQSSENTRQVFFQTIITSIQENKNISTINPLLEQFLSKNSFEYALNAFHSVFFSLVSLTFLIVFLLRHTRRLLPLLLSDSIIYCGISILVIWSVSYVAIIGITGPPQIPNISIESPLSNKS